MSHKTPLKYASVSTKKIKKPTSYFQKKKSGFSFGNVSRLRGWWRFVLRAIAACIGLLLLGYAYLSTTLPDLDDMEDVILPEATVIMDRNGQTLYKIFQENRSYIQYEDISEHMINAIVAIEDQSFWTNNGIDYGGILRIAAGQLGLINYSGGGSTITQQLLKNIILTNESSIYSRKIKEWMLAGKLNDVIKSQVKETNPGIRGDELQRKMKEEILELYLNYIFLGQNSYGVQAASQTFFGKDAKELTPLEAAIIASLPQSPTKYNPYVNRDPVMGKLRFLQGAEEVSVSDGVIDKAHEQIATLLPRLQMQNKDVGAIEKQLAGLMDFTLTAEGTTYRVSYDMGRKDYVLMNMVDEGMLDPASFKTAFLDGFEYQFTEGGTIDIKAPHFVRWVQDVILEMFPEEGEQLLQRGGLQVVTTLDYQMQEWAERALEENYRNVIDYGANNAGLVHLDSTNGDVLTYVGSADYFEKEIDGEVDMVRALRQPGSSIKPLIYALGIEKLGLTMDTPIFDLPLKVGGNTPQNADGNFNGLMPVRKALAYSRNIAPIKIFLALGGEEIVKPFLWNLGLRSLSGKVGYGYPLAIGAGEVQMLELANAYAHLSTSGRPAVINPILEIRNPDGSVIYKKKVEQQEQLVPDGVANMVSAILSNKNNMPPSWVSNYTLNGGVTYAIKSGTSDVKINQNGQQELRARDGRLAAYTPSKVTIFWSGNTDGKPMGPKAFGGWLNAPIWKTFWGQLVKNNLITNESFPTDGMASLTVDKYTGLLPGGARPGGSSVGTQGYSANLPSTYAPGRESFQYDASCGGKVSPLTPNHEIGEGWLVKPYTFMPDQRDLSAITSWFAASSGLFLQMPDTVCEGRDGEQNDAIAITIMKPTAGSTVTESFDVWYDIKHDTQLKTIRVYLNDVKVGEKFLRNQTNATDIMRVEAYQGLEPGEHLLVVEVADVQGFVNRAQAPIVISTEDTTPPYLLDNRIKIDQGSGSYTVYFVFADDASPIDDIVLTSGGSEVTTTRIEQSIVRFDVADLSPVSYAVTDTFGNSAQGTIDLSQFE